MGRTGVLVDRARPARLPGPPLRRRHDRLLRAVAPLAVVLATLVGGYVALANVSADRDLSVGTIRLSVDPGHRGAVDLYVPLVDWGARFERTIRLPVRMHVDVRTVDRDAVTRIAGGQPVDIQAVRREAREAVVSYLAVLLMTVFLSAIALGVLTAFAVRHTTGPKLRYTAATAAGAALLLTAALALLLPPRGQFDNPEYYAAGPSDIPRALEALEAAQRSSKVLDQELDAQLVGLARLVVKPAGRTPLRGRPSFVLASDLHNNVLGMPLLERTANRGPVLFAGDLTDRGSPLESDLVRRVVRTGRPFVFVSGNHDSDSLVRDLADDGAIILDATRTVRVAGLRVAGYPDPFERRASEDFADRYENHPTAEQQAGFAAWLRARRDKVDVVMVHSPELAAPAIAELRDDPPANPLLILLGHTHKQSFEHFAGVTIVNGGSIGAGGTGNLTEGGNFGLARVVFEAKPSFQPLAADLIEIDPGTGSATARRERLDPPAFDVSED